MVTNTDGTTTRIEFNEQSKCITTSVKIESDILSPEEVVALTKTTFLAAYKEAQDLNMLKIRG